MTDRKSNSPVLEARNVSKRFGAVVALRDASLEVSRGEIVALMGANGAGKSTFVKVLTGALKADSGDITIQGKASRFSSPGEARRAGLVPVYQEPSLIPDLDVHDNLRLGNTPVEAFRHWVNELGISKLSLAEVTRNLPLATLRILDLARALAANPHVLLLDEMTAALPTDLVERVLKVIRQQADQGQSIIYISHRFLEISEVCDRATVLRDGATVGTLAIEPGVEERVVEMMLGKIAKQLSLAERSTAVAPMADSKPRLRVRDLTTATGLERVSFDLNPGEVLGVVALEGQGQDDLFDVLAGEVGPLSGMIELDGRAMRFNHPAEAIEAGITIVPGDRAHALLMARSVHENIALPQYARFADWGAIPMAQEREQVDAAIARLQIDTRAQGEVRRLSGGNQQKVTIARWIARGVETLLLFDPTRGIDIRTKRQIYALVRELAAQGAAILYYTSELAEVQLACDRTIVIFNGRVVDVISAADADEPNLLRAAYGLTEKKVEPA